MPVVFINANSDPATTATVGPIKISGGIDNPLGSNGPKDIPSFINKILEIVMVVGVPIITLAIIYSGFLFVQSQGNSGDIETAKKTFMYTMIGAALLLGAFVISKAIQGTVADITSTTK